MPAALGAIHHLGGFLNILQFGAIINQNVCLLASCEKNPLINYAEYLTDSLFLESPSPDLLKAYFHQQKVHITSHLLVIEDKKFSALLNTCNEILKKTQFKIIDIQINTGVGHTAYLANDAQSDIAPLMPWDASFKLLPQPSEAVMKYFNI